MIIDNISCTEIKPSPIHGLGLFATKAFGPGVELCRLDGQLMPYAVLVSSDLHQIVDPSTLEWNALPDDIVLLRPVRTKYSFINHSFTPNCMLMGSPPILWTYSEIAPGEELLLDYTKERLPSAYLSGHGASYLLRTANAFA